jgi:hypothetical protein
MSKDSPRTVPSLAEALHLVPPKPSLVPSLAEALDGMPRVTPKASKQISLDAMLDFSPAAKHPNTLQVPNALPMGGVCPWWWSNSPELRSPPSTAKANIIAAGYPDATSLWSAAWAHSLHANNIPGIPLGKARAASVTTDNSEKIFSQI